MVQWWSQWIVITSLFFFFFFFGGGGGGFLVRCGNGQGWRVTFSCSIMHMMTSSDGNIFRVTGPLCREFSCHRWILRTRAVTRSFDVKQSCGWWFETPSRSLWRHCNGPFDVNMKSWHMSRLPQTRDIMIRSILRCACWWPSAVRGLAIFRHSDDHTGNSCLKFIGKMIAAYLMHTGEKNKSVNACIWQQVSSKYFLGVFKLRVFKWLSVYLPYCFRLPDFPCLCMYFILIHINLVRGLPKISMKSLRLHYNNNVICKE